jgi:hypothetical protein
MELAVAVGHEFWQVPDSFWERFFLEHHTTLAKFWGPIVGPAVAIVSFVCSIWNVPHAAVLWNGGISFGGVLSFIFRRPDRPSDPRRLPALLRLADGGLPARQLLRDDGRGRARRRVLFEGLGIERRARNAKVETASVSWNYTTYLNIVFLLLAAVLVWRYFRRGGGWEMAQGDEQAHGRGASRTRRRARPLTHPNDARLSARRSVARALRRAGRRASFDDLISSCDRTRSSKQEMQFCRYFCSNASGHEWATNRTNYA